jgi:hypothetical protein
MSSAIPDRRIGRADGLDRPSNDHFAEKPFHLAKIILQKSPSISQIFIYIPLNFQENMFAVLDFTYEPLKF